MPNEKAQWKPIFSIVRRLDRCAQAIGWRL